MNTESEESKESSRIQTELKTLINDYNTKADSYTADSSSYDKFAELNKTYLKNLQKLETEITNKYNKEYDIEYVEKYYPILYDIKKEQDKIDSINVEIMNDKLSSLDKLQSLYNNINQKKQNSINLKNMNDELEHLDKIQSINFKNMNDELERLDKDYNKSLDNDIKQNLKNIGLNILFIFGCIVLIILINNSISDWILGFILFGNCLMLVINSVKYFTNKSYKSESAKGKKAAGEGYGKFYNKIGGNNVITTAAPAIKKFIEDKKMMDINEMTDKNPVFKTFRKNVNEKITYQNNFI